MTRHVGLDYVQDLASDDGKRAWSTSRGTISANGFSDIIGYNKSVSVTERVIFFAQDQTGDGVTCYLQIGGLMVTTFVIPLLLTAVTGYLWGSLNSALIVSRLMRYEDIRKQGSGNAGATNMYRTHGKLAAVLTVLGDFLKVVPAVLLARVFVEVADASAASAAAGLLAANITAGTRSLGFDPGYIAGLFVLLGHIFPVFFDFKGGKGVMPAFAIVLLLNPPAFLVLLGIAVPVFLIFRIMSLVSVLNAILLPVVTVVLGLIARTDILYETLFALGYTILVFYSHQKNICRLLSGQEKPILRKPDADHGAGHEAGRHDGKK